MSLKDFHALFEQGDPGAKKRHSEPDMEQLYGEPEPYNPLLHGKRPSYIERIRGAQAPAYTGPRRDSGEGLHPYAAGIRRDWLKKLDDLPRPWHPSSYWDETTFQVARKLVELSAYSPWSGYSLADAEADLMAHAPTDHKWGRREHEKKWQSALEHADRNGIPEPEAGAACDLTVIDEPALHTNPATSSESSALGEWEGFGFVSWAELDAMEFPPTEWLVDGLLPAGGITLLVGPPKSCKTWLAIGFSASVCGDSRLVRGGQNIPSPADSDNSELVARTAATNPGAVLYLTPDDPNLGRFRSRVRDVCDGDEPAHLHVAAGQEPGYGATFADRLIAELDRRKGSECSAKPPVRLVVVDTLQRVKMPGKGSDRYADDVAALKQLRRVCIAHPDVAILVLHHSRKADPKRDTDPLELVSGSQGIAAGVDHVLILQVPSDRGPARTLHVMGRDGEDRKLAMMMTGRGLVQVDENPDDPARLMSDVSARIYRALRDFPNGATISELVELTGVPQVTARDRLRKLTDSGHAIRLERGVYKSAEWTGDAR